MSARQFLSCLREADFLARELAQIDREIARYAVGCAEIRRLMTIPGIDVTTAATLIATIGRIDRFASPRHLVGYLGLDPRSRQSGLGAVQHGHISKQGSATARHVLCEAAHATMRSPGPLRAFGQRVRARRNNKTCDRRRRAQARLPDLATAHPPAGLHLRAARADVPQTTPARARRRRPQAPQPTRRPRTGDTRHPRTMGDRTPSRLARRGALPHRRRQLEAPTTTYANYLTTSVERRNRGLLGRPSSAIRWRVRANANASADTRDREATTRSPRTRQRLMPHGQTGQHNAVPSAT
jgi:hypothetical protein